MWRAQAAPRRISSDVAVYLSALADRTLAPATVGRVLAAIGHHHRLAGLVPPHRAEGGPVVADVLAGTRRSHRLPPRRKAAADGDVLRDVLGAIRGDRLADLRDRALLAFGMAAALRRSELVALQVADLERRPDGLRVRIGRSKTDQDGQGAVIAVPDGRRLKPVKHLDASGGCRTATPWQHRATPVTAPSLARQAGLGRKPGSSALEQTIPTMRSEKPGRLGEPPVTTGRARRTRDSKG